MALIPSIKNHMDEWQIINVSLLKHARLSSKDILDKLMDAYQDKEGVAYIVNDRKIVCLVNLGIITRFSALKADLEKRIPDHSCRILARKMSPMGLRQIQLDLLDDDSTNFRNMFRERDGRSKNVLMVVDDDMFIRAAIRKILEFYGDVVEVEKGVELKDMYLKHNPDVVFLDIHMPDKNGLEAIDEILDMDIDAYILVSSADSIAENVLQAVERGAVGFLSKPPQKDKIVTYLNHCITLS